MKPMEYVVKNANGEIEKRFIAGSSGNKPLSRREFNKLKEERRQERLKNFGLLSAAILILLITLAIGLL